jgi:hypothetical protein
VRAVVAVLAVGLLAIAPAAGWARGVTGSPSARVQVGETPAQVRSALGARYSVCTLRTSRLCRDPVWVYEHMDGGSKGLGVRFHAGRVVAVFRLAAVTGYR